jgi:hypothetical protein
MQLSKKLSNLYFSESDSYRLKTLIEEKFTSSEEAQTIKELISETITELLLDIFPDKNLIELVDKFPDLYYTTKSFDLNLRDLGIISEDALGYSEDGELSLSPTLRMTLKRPFPTTMGTVIMLNPNTLSKLSDEKLETLKEWISRLVHLKWQSLKEIKSYNEEKYYIKTFGKLYRTNQEWYELIVRDRYKDEVLYDESEVEKQKQEAAENFIKSLEDLKPILEL